MAPKESWIDRALTRLTSMRWAELRTLRDRRGLRAFFRFSALFGATVVVPAVLLSYFALSSIRAEELVVDAELKRRADTMALHEYQVLGHAFGRFESQVAERLRTEQSLLSNLADLSPHLRVTFRFDDQGELVSPFVVHDRPSVAEPTSFYRTAWRRGLSAESEGDLLAAAEIFDSAAAVATTPSLAAEAAFAAARCLGRAGDTEEAEARFAILHAEYAHTRDRYGFRIRDLISLERAERRLLVDPEGGKAALEALADQLLSDRWALGHSGEPAIVRRALWRLSETADPDWLGRVRGRLEERTAQLLWSAELVDELELFSGTLLRSDAGQFKYYESPQTGSLWATVWAGDDLYAFSFEYTQLAREVTVALERQSALDPDIVAVLLRPEDRLPDGLLVRQSLSPWLPSESIVVAALDPAEIVKRKAQKRRTRVLVIALAVGMSVLGILLSARLVGTELEGARIKADFAANVSHELRSPITQIRLKGEALMLDLVFTDEDRQEHYSAIVHEAERLSRLVDNVLDFAAIERGKKSYILRAEDLAEIVAMATEAARNVIEGRGITLEVDLPDDLPVVWVDREAIGQVMTNLLSNAAKYGAEGKWIGVKARVGLDTLDVSVADRGIGISKGDAAQVFEHFFRSKDPKIRRNKGTGIGLTIVRYIVEAHGGTILVDSTPGKGTTFTFTLPLEPPEAAGA